MRTDHDIILYILFSDISESGAFLEYVKEIRPIYAGLENRVNILK